MQLVMVELLWLEMLVLMKHRLATRRVVFRWSLRRLEERIANSEKSTEVLCPGRSLSRCSVHAQLLS